MKRTHSFDNGTHVYATAFGGQMIGTNDLPKMLKDFDKRHIGMSKKELFMMGIKVDVSKFKDESSFRGKIARAWAQIREANKAN